MPLQVKEIVYSLSKLGKYIGIANVSQFAFPLIFIVLTFVVVLKLMFIGSPKVTFFQLFKFPNASIE